MRYQLPQFIETEIKIVGPFTLKQFLWLAGGAAILFLIFTLTKGGLLFFVLAIPVAGIFLALAFMKIQDAPLIVYVSYGLSYILNPKKYVFRKDDQQPTTNYQPHE